MKQITRIAIGATLVLSGVLTGLSAGASSSTDGLVTGYVFECGPGPIVVSPGRPAPQPIPATVTLRHDGKNERSVSISFKGTLAWSGRFNFHVPAGRYEVISSYLHQVEWVRVHVSATSVVHFGPFDCPMESAT
jgi:hypothetical protein